MPAGPGVIAGGRQNADPESVGDPVRFLNAEG